MESLEIVYSDEHLLACIKPAGVNSEEELISILKNQLGGSFYSVHRLDKPVSGLIVLAKNEKSAAKMTALISGREVKKQYLAVVEGAFSENTGVYNDLLFYDKSKAKSYVVKRVRKGVKDASLDYTVLEKTISENSVFSLVKINLHTGRTHQIRVQFGSRKHAVVGDARYGSNNKGRNIALLSYGLKFIHPFTGENIELTAHIPQDYPWHLFNKAISQQLN